MNAPGSDINEICQKVTAILYDHPYLPPKRPAAESLGRIVMESGIETAENSYQNLKTKQAADYDFNENEFNNLGYYLLGLTKYKEAIAVFKWNVNDHPTSANTYDSLAEAYMTAGDKENAVFYYTMALEKLEQDTNITPAFRQQLRDGATEKLKRLKETKQ